MGNTGDCRLSTRWGKDTKENNQLDCHNTRRTKLT